MVGDEFVPLVNKAGGAGTLVMAYAQIASDLALGIGDRAKVGQVSGNRNTLNTFRVKNGAAAELLATQLPPAWVFTKTAAIRVTEDFMARVPGGVVSVDGSPQLPQ